MKTSISIQNSTAPSPCPITHQFQTQTTPTTTRFSINIKTRNNEKKIKYQTGIFEKQMKLRKEKQMCSNCEENRLGRDKSYRV